MAAITLKEHIDYRSPGKEKVDLIFAIAGPPKDRHIHLTLLSKIAQIGLQPEIIRKLRESKNSAQFLQTLYHCNSMTTEKGANEKREKLQPR